MGGDCWRGNIGEKIYKKIIDKSVDGIKFRGRLFIKLLMFNDRDKKLESKIVDGMKQEPRDSHFIRCFLEIKIGQRLLIELIE